MKRKALIWTTSIAAVLIILITACAVYLNDYYKADTGAIDSYAPADGISIIVLSDNSIVYAPEDAKSGFVFYPGGKVEHTAYIPLMQELAGQGVLCVLMKMPFHLAVLDQNAADGIQEQFPEIENWYIGGHSLGGAMAASYLSDRTDDYNGLVLLGAYSTEDLSNADIDVLSVYGSEDTVLNPEKYESNKCNLPGDFTELIIDGGCHSYFGMYGMQEGDGIPAVTNAEQIRLTADAIAEFIGNAN